jgi:cytochrome c oxidase subunit 6a
MFAQRQVSRVAQRFGAQVRVQGQRRFASTTESEFARERRHVKEHAAATTREDLPPRFPRCLWGRTES